MRNPPILISVLGFFAIMAGFMWIVIGLRAIGIDWGTALGDMPSFEHLGIWGWLAIAAGIAWIAAGIGLWALQPWAWLFANIIAVFGLVEAFFVFINQPLTGGALVSALVPVLILWYLHTPEVKASFIIGGIEEAASQA